MSRVVGGGPQKKGSCRRMYLTLLGKYNRPSARYVISPYFTENLNTVFCV